MFLLHPGAETAAPLPPTAARPRFGGPTARLKGPRGGHSFWIATSQRTETGQSRPARAKPGGARHRGPGYARYRSEKLYPQNPPHTAQPRIRRPHYCKRTSQPLPGTTYGGAGQHHVTDSSRVGRSGVVPAGRTGETFPVLPDRTNFFQHFFFRQKKCEKKSILNRNRSGQWPRKPFFKAKLIFVQTKGPETVTVRGSGHESNFPRAKLFFVQTKALHAVPGRGSGHESHFPEKNYFYHTRPITLVINPPLSITPTIKPRRHPLLFLRHSPKKL